MKILLDKSIRIKGVTLTELMISVAIMGLLVSIVGTFMVKGVSFFRLSRARGEIQRDARVSVDLINRNLRQGQALTVNLTRYNSDQPPLSMIEFTHINGTSFRFYQLGDKFYMATMPSGEVTWREKKMADNLRNLAFTYPQSDDSNIVSTSLCFEKATYRGETKALQLSVEKIRIMN